MYFESVRPLSSHAQHILEARYFHIGETTWEQVTDRVVNYVLKDCTDSEQKKLTRELILNRYFLPNSPCIANSDTKTNGLAACFVVDFNDSIIEIYKTKLEFALIAKKAGGCGTTLSKIRPEGDIVNGSAHGHAGGPINFADTICKDMKIVSQNGVRDMAIMLVMDYTHPDIIRFITAKTEEGKLSNANLSVRVDKEFINMVKNDADYTTFFDYPDKRVYYHTYKARDIFNLIVEGMWKNGEPGLQFLDKINENTPYKYSGQVIYASNPCSEQYLPPNGVCNLGSLDFSKFVIPELRMLDLKRFEVAIRLATRFLNAVAEVSDYPTDTITSWVKNNLAIGLGGMGFADYLLMKEIPYGSPESLTELEFITKMMYDIANDESIKLGEERGIPEACKSLPIPRRNITLISYAPTGTLSLLAGCSSSIEPIFSEVTIRNDKVGTYTFENDLIDKSYFRCAVSMNGGQEVTWEEHLNVLNSAQRFCDSGCSKTINCPNHTRKETIANLVLHAFELPYIKGFTVYRNMSRKQEVLTPKNLKKNLCPVCGKELIEINNIKKCPDVSCGFVLTEISQ